MTGLTSEPSRLNESYIRHKGKSSGHCRKGSPSQVRDQDLGPLPGTSVMATPHLYIYCNMCVTSYRDNNDSCLKTSLCLGCATASQPVHHMHISRDKCRQQRNWSASIPTRRLCNTMQH